MNVEDSTVMVVDLSGSFTHIAEAVAPDVKRCLYHTNWQTGFPHTRDFLPGVGLAYVERADNLFDYLSEVDWFVFTDVGMGDLQEYLRAQGYPVCGSGAGQLLEQDRWALRSIADGAGIQVSQAELVHGIDELRAVLREADKCYVKVSLWRGLMETYCHRDWFMTEVWLNDLASRLGPAGKIIDFLVEEPIDGEPCVEIGFDSFYGGGFPETSLWGYEAKDLGFLGFTTPMPDLLRELQEKTGIMLGAFDYRGPISTEFRITPQGAYLIDITARFPSPPSEIETKVMENFAEVLFWCAQGTMIEPQYTAPIVAQYVMTSHWAEERALGLEIEDMSHVALHGHCNVDGKDYVVSPANLAEFAGAVGWGDTIASAVKSATTAAEGIKGYQVSFNAGALDEAKKTVGTGRELGIDP